MSVRTSLFRVALRRGRSWDCPRISIRGGCTGAQPARWGREPAGSRGQVMPNMKRPARSKRQPGDTQEMAAERGVSQPKVSHQVETNVVTQAERPPVPLRESDPAAPPRAAADDRRNSVLGRVCRASVHSTAGRIVGGTAQYPVWARPWDGPSSSRDRTRRARRAGHGQRFPRWFASASRSSFRHSKRGSEAVRRHSASCGRSSCDDIGNIGQFRLNLQFSYFNPAMRFSPGCWQCCHGAVDRHL